MPWPIEIRTRLMRIENTRNSEEKKLVFSVAGTFIAVNHPSDDAQNYRCGATYILNISCSGLIHHLMKRDTNPAMAGALDGHW
jgi:hypothetical protein